MSKPSDIGALLIGLRNVQGLNAAFAVDESGSCIAHATSATAPTETIMSGVTQVAYKLSALLRTTTQRGREPLDSLIVRYERSYLIIKQMGAVTVIVTAQPSVNFSMLNVAFRVLELKISKGFSDSGEFTVPQTIRHVSVDELSRDPLICSFETLLTNYSGPAAKPLFKARLRLFAKEVELPLKPERYSEFAAILARLIREPAHRDLFLVQAENAVMRAANEKLAAERDELRTLIGAIEEGVRICRRIATPTSGVQEIEDEKAANDVIDFCATYDRVLNAHGQSFRENFLRLTDQLLATRRELADAGKLQRMLVPGSNLIRHSFAQLAVYFRPAAQCGGDWWTTKSLPGEKLLVVIGDVTGHSLSTAIITGVAKAACDAVNMIHGDIPAADLLHLMNRSIYDATRGKVLMTCAASILDPSTRTMAIASAGHNFPYLAREKDGKHELRNIVSRGAPLGSAPSIDIETTTVDLAIGDLLVWYTDGTTECENDQAEPFGDRRFRRLIRNAASSDVTVVRDTILKELASFWGAANPNDDVTFIAGKVAGPS